MGLDTAHIFNHNIQYKHGAELLQQLEKRLGKPLLNVQYDSKNNYPTKLPKNFDGYIISTENNTTIEHIIETTDLLEFDAINPQKNAGHFEINPFVIMNSLTEVYMLRWWQTAEMCKLIREFGMQTKEYYEAKDIPMLVGYSSGCYMLELRKKIQPFIQQLGSTKMLSFCADHHTIYADYIAANYTFDDFVSWGKKEFIYVEFKDLHLFDFPEKKPDCYNVFIYDDFSDLK
jgi:hypothetical protein